MAIDLKLLPHDARSYHIHSTTRTDHCSSGQHGDQFQLNEPACVDAQTDHKEPKRHMHVLSPEQTRTHY